MSKLVGLVSYGVNAQRVVISECGREDLGGRWSKRTVVWRGCGEGPFCMYREGRKTRNGLFIVVDGGRQFPIQPYVQ